MCKLFLKNHIFQNAIVWSVYPRTNPGIWSFCFNQHTHTHDSVWSFYLKRSLWSQSQCTSCIRCGECLNPMEHLYKRDESKCSLGHSIWSSASACFCSNISRVLVWIIEPAYITSFENFKDTQIPPTTRQIRSSDNKVMASPPPPFSNQTFPSYLQYFCCFCCKFLVYFKFLSSWHSTISQKDLCK